MNKRISRPGSQIVSDQQLRADAKTLTQTEIAAKHEITVQAVNQRLTRLGIYAAASMIAEPNINKATAKGIDALAQLGRSLEKVNLLMDACDDWLRDPADPNKYTLYPRAEEVDITYRVEIDRGDKLVTEKRKAKLSALLALVETDPEGNRIVETEKGEYRHADPRELIIKTAQETRSTVDSARDLARMLVDWKAIQDFRDAVIAAIKEVDADTSERIVQSIRRRVVLQVAFSGLGAIQPDDQ